MKMQIIIELIKTVVTLIYKLIEAIVKKSGLADETQKKAHELINEYVSKARKSICSADFFNKLLGTENHEKIDTFYNNIPLFDHMGKKVGIRKLTKSYIIVADAGQGKSTILQRKFLNHRIVIGRSYAIYLNSNGLKEYLNNDDNIKTICDNLNKLKFRTLTLYLDGIDELDDVINKNNNKDKLKQLVKSFMECCPFRTKFNLCLACRTKYYERNDISNLFFQSQDIFYNTYTVGDWTEKKHLCALSKKILNAKEMKAYCRADYNRHKRYNVLKQNIYSNDKIIFTTSFISNPLLLKLYIYIGLNSDVASLGNLEKNEYYLFEKFIEVLFLISNQGNKIDEEQYKEFLKEVFNKFKNNVRLMESNINDNMKLYLKPIIKDNNNYVTFAHKRFFEFFVVKLYINTLLKDEVSSQTIDVLSNYYTNDYADLITSVLASEDDSCKQIIVNKLISLYYCTIKETRGTSISDKIKNEIRQLDIQRLLHLKHEIIFRLGRLDITNCEINNTIIVFFKEMYFNDTANNYQDYNDYSICLIKRWLAVSSSFIGGEDIEIDYAQKMIENSEDNNYYDLANIFYMMIFYNDLYCPLLSPQLLSTNNDPKYILQEIGQHHNCYDKTKTWMKCRNRLKPFYGKKGDVRSDILTCGADNDSNYRKELKRYYFRVFDFATLYTMKRRAGIELDDECVEIIKNAKIDFENMSEQRKQFLTKIKRLLIEKIE